MNFIKQFGSRGGRVSTFGSAIIKDGFLKIRIPNTYDIVEKGFIEGGIGLTVKPCSPRKSPYTTVHVNIGKDYLPPELCGQNYKFGIPAEKISDTEIVFMFKRAKMLTHK